MKQDKRYEIWEYDMRENGWHKKQGVVLASGLTWKEVKKIKKDTPDYLLRITVEL